MDSSSSKPKEIKAPPTFPDANGRRWTIKLTLGLIEGVQERCGIDLAPDDNDISPVAGLLFNTRKLGGLLWECCRKQAEADGIDREAFFEALDEDALSAGWGAVVDAIVFFIHSKSPKVAESVRLAVEAQMQLLEAGAEQMQKAMQSDVTKQGIAEALDQIGRQMQSELNQALTQAATDRNE